MLFCHAICIYFSGFMPQEVDRNQHYSRVFYMAPSLIRGGCLLVNYRWSIFHFGNPSLEPLREASLVNQTLFRHRALIDWRL